MKLAGTKEQMRQLCFKRWVVVIILNVLKYAFQLAKIQMRVPPPLTSTVFA
jgi:hypothetical protein